MAEGVRMKANCPECKRRVRIRKNTRDNTCKCGHEFLYSRHFEIVPIYLIDANVFIYAINKDKYHGKCCHELLTISTNLATTKQVISEVKQYNPYRIRYIIVKKISEEVHELRYNSIKELSVADKSLIQCAIDNPHVAGIITNDYDIKSVVPERLIRNEKAFFIGRPNEFLKKR